VIALVGAEFTKAVRRSRSLFFLAALVGLPALITAALHARGARPERDAGEGLFRLAHSSGLLVPAAVLGVMSGFLLVVIAGMIAGEAVAGEAASGNLRYVLIRPVSRARLLVAKAIVSGVLIWVAVILVAVAGLVAGVSLFGWHAVSVPGVRSLTGGSLATGFQLSTGTLLTRLVVATAYVAFGFTGLLAMGTLFSTMTDTPAGAIGATVGVYIVSEILDGITELGRVRYGFPTHYQGAWEALFTENRYSHDLIAGLIVQLAYLAVFGGIALWWFRRKDIRS